MSFLLNTFLVVSLAASGFASPLSTNPHELPRSNAFSYAPLHTEHHPHGSVNNSYIVMFKDDVHPFMFEEHFSLLDGLKGQFPLEQIESGLNHVWNSHIKGYAGKFSREVMEMIRTQPEVDYIEQDQVVYALETQKSAPWVSIPS